MQVSKPGHDGSTEVPLSKAVDGQCDDKLSAECSSRHDQCSDTATFVGIVGNSKKRQRQESFGDDGDASGHDSDQELFESS